MQVLTAVTTNRENRNFRTYTYTIPQSEEDADLHDFVGGGVIPGNSLQAI